MATKSKHRKNHKQKVAARNSRIQESKNAQNKLMQEYMKQIKAMQENAGTEKSEAENAILLPEVNNVAENKL